MKSRVLYSRNEVTVQQLLSFLAFFRSIVCVTCILLLEQLLRFAANHENQIAIHLYAQSAHVLRDVDHDERTAAS